MLWIDVPLNTPKRSPQKPSVHFTASMGVEFTTANLLLRVSVMPFCCAVAGIRADAERKKVSSALVFLCIIIHDFINDSAGKLPAGEWTRVFAVGLFLSVCFSSV